MICFKDKTFCDHYESCAKGASCPDALTLKVIADAKRWWGSVTNDKDEEYAAPISRYTDKPYCFKSKE